MPGVPTQKRKAVTEQLQVQVGTAPSLTDVVSKDHLVIVTLESETFQAEQLHLPV